MLWDCNKWHIFPCCKWCVVWWNFCIFETSSCINTPLTSEFLSSMRAGSHMHTQLEMVWVIFLVICCSNFTCFSEAHHYCQFKTQVWTFKVRPCVCRRGNLSMHDVLMTTHQIQSRSHILSLCLSLCHLQIFPSSATFKESKFSSQIYLPAVQCAS